LLAETDFVAPTKEKKMKVKYQMRLYVPTFGGMSVGLDQIRLHAHFFPMLWQVLRLDRKKYARIHVEVTIGRRCLEYVECTLFGGRREISMKLFVLPSAKSRRDLLEEGFASAIKAKAERPTQAGTAQGARRNHLRGRANDIK
jgi:hypothetical protein